ncbi:MAG: molybdopterin molybdotransferase MoeA [Chloroflexi bacterium]|nr:molybdopterin molybdotransferase MoeA [Chloroflexota bacterium]
MLSVSDALSQVLAKFKPLDAEWVPTAYAAGRVLAQTVHASLDLPPFPNSSMDGYAVRAADVRAASPATPALLTVIGDIPAGAVPSMVVRPGCAARIMTGAHMPQGADAVVPVEATDDSRSTGGGPLPVAVRVLKAVEAGEYVRHQGEDMKAGAEILRPGMILRPYDLGMLAATGCSKVSVVRRPRVAILSTGDELVPVETEPGPGQIRDTNGYTLGALVRKYGGEALMLGAAPDQADAVDRMLGEALEQAADVIVSSAGVSVGAYDVVKAAVERRGVLSFWKVRMRPGKPIVFGRLGAVPFFGLPGNPVSAVVGFEIFVRPALLKLSGRTRIDKPVVSVLLTETWHSDGRESYLRAVVSREDGRYVARSAGGQGSNMISALSAANALLILPEGVTEAPAGSTLRAWMLDWPEEVF